MGDTVTYTCTSVLGPATIEWLDIDNENMMLEMDSDVMELALVLGPVSQSMNGRRYRCAVTVGGTSSTTVTLVIQGEPSLVHSTPEFFLHCGEKLVYSTFYVTNNPWLFCHRVFFALWRKLGSGLAVNLLRALMYTICSCRDLHAHTVIGEAAAFRHRHCRQGYQLRAAKMRQTTVQAVISPCM